MSKRKYTITNLTPEHLEEISKLYPKAVQTVRKPVYKVIAMLLECGLEVPGMDPITSITLTNPGRGYQDGDYDVNLPPLLREKK